MSNRALAATVQGCQADDDRSDGMEINVNLDPKQIEQYVANAVLESALGEAVRKVIDEEVARIGRGWDSALSRAVNQEVQRIVLEVIRDEYGDIMRAAVREKITDEVIGEATSAAWEAFYDKLRA